MKSRLSSDAPAPAPEPAAAPKPRRLELGGRPLRVLMLNQFFHPDLAATAQLMTDLAVDLASTGAEVTVLTGRAPYVGTGRFAPRELYRGVTILRLPTTAFGRGRIAGRIADYASFYVGCAARAATLPPHDVVIALSTPPLLSLVGSALRRLRGSRLVYWVQDLYPDVAIRLGALQPHAPLTRVLGRLSAFSLHSADAIVALGDSMAGRLLDKGAPPEKLHVVHNWSDGDEIGAVDPKDNWFLDRHGLRGKFVVLYSGNMGRGHEFETLLGAAKRLAPERQDIAFVFIGDGAKRAEIERAQGDLPNVRLLPYQRREDLPYSLGAGDVSVITLADGLEGLIVPSKLYGALAARKPILYVGPKAGEVARVVREVGCGRAFEPGQSEEVATYLTQLADDPKLGRDLGQRGRVAFERRFTRARATARFAELCLDLASGLQPRDAVGEVALS